jgi:uncharacterized protein (UPF0276 family)
MNLGYDAQAFRSRPAARLRHDGAHRRWRGGNESADLSHTPDGHASPPVADQVFELLTLVGTLAPQPLTVVLERDGAFPLFPELLDELARARDALNAGRRAGVLKKLPVGRRVQ